MKFHRLLILLLLVLPNIAAAAPPDGQLSDHSARHAWLENYDPTLRWDLLAETDRQRLELGGTRLWGADNQYALSFGTEVPLESESFEFKLLGSFHWYF